VVRVALGLALPFLAFAGCGDDESAVDPATAQAPADSQEREPRVLELPDRGHPFVEVRRGRRVDLYDSPRGKVIDTVGEETEFSSPTAFAVQRVRDGWAAVPTAHFENGRLAWLRLDPRRLRARSTYYSVEIDLSEFRTDLLFRDRVVNSFEVSIGMPEAPTPTGRFAVTDTFRGDLNAAYGCCAVALTARQTRLPSGWLGGDRIAIHGTSGPLGAAISHGCVRAENPEVSDLVDRLWPGTPVTIRQ
jgi:hypothetical protein